MKTIFVNFLSVLASLRFKFSFAYLGLILVLVWGAALRFGWLGVNSFAFDEARLSLISLRMARGGEFAALGMPSSAGVPNLPAAAWIFAIPYAISPDPLVATLWAGLLNLIALAGVWWLARRAWGGWAALVAGLFFAASPYAVLYSRSVWAQNLLPVLGLLWLWTGYIAITKKADEAGRVPTSSRRGKIALAGHVFIAGFAFQVHFAGAALALGTLYLFLRFRWWRQLVSVMIGGGLAALLLIPTLLYVLNHPDVAAQFQNAVGGTAQVDLAAFGELIRLALNEGWGYLAAGDLSPAQSPVLAWVVGAVLVVGMGAVVRHLVGTALMPSVSTVDGIPNNTDAIHRVPTHGRILAELVLVLLIVTPLFFVRHSTPVFLHYQLLALPALTLMAGASTQLIRHRMWSIVVTTVMIGLALLWSVSLNESLALAAERETPNGLGTPLGIAREAADSLPDELPVLFFTHGDDPNVNGEAAVFAALWWDRPHRLIQGESVLILPSYPAALMATLAPFQAWEELGAANLAQDVTEIARRDGALPFEFTLYDGGSEPEGFTAIEPVRFADGTQLEGWRVRRVGPRLRVSTLWRVVEAPPSGVIQQFHHLHNADTLAGAPLVGSDVPVSAHRWQVGDRLIVMGDFFDVGAGEYWVDVGHYTLPDLARIPREDGLEDGRVRLGPFGVE